MKSLSHQWPGGYKYLSSTFSIKYTSVIRTSLVVQQLRLHAFAAGDEGLIPGWGTKDLHATRHGQKVKKKKSIPQLFPGVP